ncbi:helix-turn-helix transcriptional regulator [Paenibacillus pasadenensis]|uniref:helix-turn-helix transcriptional regulator n=1 Tax=Paenibacillus pasadenensis TaxID=217090 RepID=UPI00040DECA2|nr:helix-turn-helix transcriptional regulator [Paenibacillus pasadenensis]
MKLKDARKKNKKTQEEVADHCGISRRYYQNIEYGDQEPTIRLALKICRFLEVSPFYIEEWNDLNLD